MAREAGARLGARVARAQARAQREAAVAQQNPLAWLRMGPGRERPGEPGWTDAQRTELNASEGRSLQFTLVIEEPTALDMGSRAAAGARVAG